MTARAGGDRPLFLIRGGSGPIAIGALSSTPRTSPRGPLQVIVFLAGLTSPAAMHVGPVPVPRLDSRQGVGLDLDPARG